MQTDRQPVPMGWRSFGFLPIDILRWPRARAGPSGAFPCKVTQRNPLCRTLTTVPKPDRSRHCRQTMPPATSTIGGQGFSRIPGSG